MAKNFTRTSQLYKASILITVSVTFLSTLTSQAELEELEETIIIASRRDESALKSAGTTSSVTSNQLLKTGSISLVDALQRTPGVSVPFDFSGVDALVPYLEGGSKAINIRGLEGNRVNLQIDGIRQPEDFVARSFLGAGGPGRVYFDPSVFSQIEIYKSASSSLYGSDALAGSVLGRTEEPETLLGRDLEGSILKSTTTWSSENNSLNERIAAAIGNGDQAISIVYSYRNGHETINNSNLDPNPVDFDSHALITKGVFKFKNFEIAPTLDIFRLDSFTNLQSIQSTGLVGETLDSTSDSTTERVRLSTDLTFIPDRDLIAFDRLDLKLYYQNSLSKNFNTQKLLIDAGLPSEFIRDRINDLFYKTGIAGINLKAEKFFEFGTISHNLQYGYEGSRSEVSSALLRTDGSSPTDNLVNMAPAEVWRNGLYLSDRISFGQNEKFIITPSIRFEHYKVSPENTDDFLQQTQFSVFDSLGRVIGTESIEAKSYENFSISPSLSLLYNINDELNIYLTSSIGTRNPSAEELTGVFQHEDDFITLPNPDLTEEKSSSNEIGIQYDNGSLSFQVSAYWNFYKDFLESNVATGEFLEGREIQRTINQNEVEIYGIEAEVDWRIGDHIHALEGFSVGGSLAWSEGDIINPNEGRTPLNTIEPFKASTWINYTPTSNRWGMELTASYHAEKDEDDISGGLDPTESYILVDLVGHYNVNDSITFRAGLKNILNQDYIIWSRANRGSGHNGSSSNGRDSQPGINGFVSVEFTF